MFATPFRQLQSVDIAPMAPFLNRSSRAPLFHENHSPVAQRLFAEEDMEEVDAPTMYTTPITHRHFVTPSAPEASNHGQVILSQEELDFITTELFFDEGADDCAVSFFSDMVFLTPTIRSN